MNSLKLAIQFLGTRAVSTENAKDPLIKNMGSVISISEVFSVLDMVEKDEFLDFCQKMKAFNHPNFKTLQLEETKKISAVTDEDAHKIWEVLNQEEQLNLLKAQIGESDLTEEELIKLMAKLPLARILKMIETAKELGYSIEE